MAVKSIIHKHEKRCVLWLLSDGTKKKLIQINMNEN